MAAEDKHERRVFLWKLAAGVSPKDATPDALPTINELLTALKASVGTSAAVMHLSAEMANSDDEVELASDIKNRIYLADVSISDDGFATLLINRGDPRVADPAFIKQDAKVRVASPKKMRRRDGQPI